MTTYLKTQIFLILILMATPLPSWAVDACQDLNEFTCQQGTYDDGTGSFTLPKGEQLRQAHNKYRTLSEPQFLTSLQRNPGLRDKTLEAIGLDTPSCLVHSPESISSCNQVLSQRLSELTVQFPSKTAYAEIINHELLFEITGHSEFNRIVNNTHTEVEKGYPLEERMNNIRNKTLPSIKKHMARKIESLPISEDMKKKMIRRIQGTQLSGHDCTPPVFQESSAVTQMNSLFFPNAYYSSHTNSIKICKGLLSDGFSEFTISRIVAHELAHAIDPCQFAHGPEDSGIRYSRNDSFDVVRREYPLRDLTTCLRSSKSINAQINSAKINASPLTSEDICLNDQMGEAVADWFAGEVMADHLSEAHPHLTSEQWQKGLANSFRVFCGDSHSEEFIVHPEAKRRINNIIAVNPRLRSKMNCSNPVANAVYCDGTVATGIGTSRPVARPEALGSPASSENPRRPPRSNRVQGTQ